MAVLLTVLLLAPAALGQGTGGLTELERLLQGKVPPHRVVRYAVQDGPSGKTHRTYLLHGQALLTGERIADARVVMDPSTGRPEVALRFDRKGAKLLEELTGKHVKERLAVVLDEEVLLAAIIQGPIRGGSARIAIGARKSYDLLLRETHDLAVALRVGRLPVAVRLKHELGSPVGTGMIFELDAEKAIERRPAESKTREGPESRKKSLRDALVEEGVRVLRVRLEESGLGSVMFEAELSDERDPRHSGRVFLMVPLGVDPLRVISVMTREALLEFRLVDDRSQTIAALAGRLPDGIEMECYRYGGPEGETITSSYLVARDRRRLVDYLHNVPEIESFLRKAEVDQEVASRILGLAGGGIDEEERRQILELATESLGRPR
ncbi:MAG: hypothetical protein JXR96_17625 [Deltaproteobacteria bacterium]|nr:hypothetical protein [Deltaproteobacteria bacterium]